MDGSNRLAEQFEANRNHLRRVAQRMLGAAAEADDAVQEAWLRLARADSHTIGNLKAWLTTVVARVCLDMLRARKARREAPMPEADALTGEDATERVTEVSDSIGVAMLVVLETLTPSERVAFVLHDMFGLPFDDIAPLLNRTTAAARQLASRARRRVQDGQDYPDVTRERRRKIVEAFLAASRGGDFAALLALLDPEVVLRADEGAIAASVARLGDTPELAPEIRGSQAVAERFRGRARMAQVMLLDGEPGLVIAPGGTPRMLFDFVIVDDRITEIAMMGNPPTIAAMTLEP